MKNKLKSFKDFHVGDIDIDEYEGLNSDSLLKKSWKKIKDIANNEDIKLAATLLLFIYIMFGRSSKSDVGSTLEDISSGRVSFNTVEAARDVLYDLFKKVSRVVK